MACGYCIKTGGEHFYHHRKLSWTGVLHIVKCRLQSMGSRRVRHDWATSLSCIGEGNGNPLQCSCLENPRDGGAWWPAIYGVAHNRTRLKWLNRVESTWNVISKLEKFYYISKCWVSFDIPFHRLDVFGKKTSMYFLCLFFNWIVWFLVIELYEFFIFWILTSYLTYGLQIFSPVL